MIEEFLKKVDKKFLENKPILRYGQTLMIVLHEYDKSLYKKITGSDLDCFYDDATVKFTIKGIEKEWRKNV